MDSLLTLLLMGAGIAVAVGLSYASMSLILAVIPWSQRDK
jgi:hypothetical protein